MSNLLPQVLRQHSVNASDDDDPEALYDLIMKQDVKVQVGITIEFAKRLVAQHGSNTDVPDEYDGWTLPLHVLSVQAWVDERPWSDVVLLLKNLPPRMAKDALMRPDGNFGVPLHYAAGNRSVIDRMLALAPDAARAKDSSGNLPLHYAAADNNVNVDAIEPLMNAYPNALLETNKSGDTPIDFAINNGRSDEFLKKMFLVAMKRACSNKFLNYGTLLDDESHYNNSINPINLILIEANHGKRSANDVVEFIDQLNQKPTMFRSLLYHAKKSNKESSPADRARKLDFRTKDARTRVVNALSGDNKEGLALHNASTGLDDSPDVPDRLGRQPLAKACAQVLKEIETPSTSFTCSVAGGWGSGKTKFADMLVEEMLKRKKNIKKEPETFTFTPTLTFIIVCILVKKYLYDMFLCRCLSKPTRSENMDQTPNAANIVLSQTNTEIEPLLAESESNIVADSHQSVGGDADYDVTHLDSKEWFYILTFPISFPASYVYNLFQTGRTDEEIDEENGVDVEKLDKNGEAMIIALCIILFSPVVLLTMMFYYIAIKTGQNFGRTPRAYNQDSDEYRSASLVLQTLFKSQPENDLPCIVSRTIFIVLYVSRLSYVAYDEVSKWLNDCEPFLIKSNETKYIDVRFNAWEYSGSDVLWASLIQKLYDEVKKEFSKKEFQIYYLYNTIYDELDNKTRVRISDKIKERYKHKKYLQICTVAIVVLLIVGMMILLVYDLSLSSVKIVVAQVGAIVTSIVALAQFLKHLHKANKDTLQEAIDQIRSTARVSTSSEQKDKGRDYKVGKGFMGDIKYDVKRLMDYLGFQNARLVIVIDDLDRCKEKDIVDILQAVVLLLIDSPITCFLAIDNRVVISVLEKYMDNLCSKEGITGQEYLDKIIQLPINIDIIDDVVKLDYIELSSEGKSLTVTNLLERIIFFKNQEYCGDDFTNWRKDVESVKDPTKRLHAAVTYLCSKPEPKLFMSVPSFDSLEGDKEKLEIFLFSISRALNNIIYSGEEDNDVGRQDNNASTDTDRSNEVLVDYWTGPVPELEPIPALDLSEYDQIYSPILSRRELNAFKDLLFIIPSNPRKIKRILNMYSLVRTYRSHRFNNDNSDRLTRKLLKFIILLERWPYATSLIIEVINRLNYERDDENNQVSLHEDSYNANLDRKALCNRILLYFKGITKYKSLKLRCLYDALEQELLHCDAISLRSMLSKDDDIRLFKKCLFHEDKGIILKVEDIAELKTYAFNLNSMLIDQAGKNIDAILCHTSRNDGHVRDDMIIPFSSLV